MLIQSQALKSGLVVSQMATVIQYRKYYQSIVVACVLCGNYLQHEIIVDKLGLS